MSGCGRAAVMGMPGMGGCAPAIIEGRGIVSFNGRAWCMQDLSIRRDFDLIYVIGRLMWWLLSCSTGTHAVIFSRVPAPERAEIPHCRGRGGMRAYTQTE